MEAKGKSKMNEEINEKMLGRPAEYFKERHSYWTAKEIGQQPRVWRELAEMLLRREAELTGFMDRVMETKGLRVITTGAGSSAFVGEALQYMLAGELGWRSENIHTTDIISVPDEVLFDVPTLLISCARSGESPESTAAVRFAEKKISRLWHIILVCDKESTLAKTGYALENAIVLDLPPKTCDRGFAMTSSVSSMALAAWCLFHYKELSVYAGYIRKLADSVEKQMDSLGRTAERIAKEQYRRIVWLGSGALKGLAREACIKSMELTDGYVHAGYDAAAGFRHGPKTVINEETLTVHFISDRPYTRKYDVDFLKEMIAEKDENVIVSVKEQRFRDCISGEDYEVIYELPQDMPDNTEMGAYIHMLVFTQLLSMHKSLEKHFRTDSPCEKGCVNRLVQGVTIYEI